MNVDIVFAIAGAAACTVSVVMLGLALFRSRRGNWVPGMLWALLGAGLLIQAFAPNLKIERNRFVVPPPAEQAQTLSPKAVVDRERQMQLLSALLAGLGTVGLAFRYRGALTGSGSSEKPVESSA